MKKLNIEIGTKFGKWEVISNNTIIKNNLTHWECRCECGKVKNVPLNNLMNGSSTQCIKCSNKETGIKKRKGYGKISGEYWGQIKHSLNKKKNKAIFTIRIEEAWEQYLKQNGKCYLTGRDIGFSDYSNNKNNTAALITKNKHNEYIKNEIIWIHKDIFNIIKNINYEDFIKIIKEIFNYKLK